MKRHTSSSMFFLPPGKNDLEVLENLKSIIKQGQHEFYRAVPQPAALAALYMGHHDPDNTIEPTTPLSAADTSPAMPEPSVPDSPPADTKDPGDAATKDDDPPQSTAENVDDAKDRSPTTHESNGDARPQDRFIDRDRVWERDRDRHDPRGRDRDVRDRRTEFFGRSYGRSHAPRPPPELRHYEPSYGADYVPPPRRYDPDDRRPAPRTPSFEDRPKPPPFDDCRPDDRRLTLDDRPVRPLPAHPPSSEDRVRPAPEARATADVDRAPRSAPLVADDRPRAAVPLEERLSQPALVPAPSLQDRLSQPAPAPSAPTLEERLSLGPVPPRTYRAASVARDDLRAPLPRDDPREHDRITDFRTNRDFSRERPGGPLTTYRPDIDRGFPDRDDRDRRERDVPLDTLPPRFGDTFTRLGPPPQRRYTPPPIIDRDRERERPRSYYPTRSPPPFRGEGAYHPEGERRYVNDRDRDAYEQRRREWYGPGDDDKRAPVPPPPASWRPHERPPFVDRDRERLDRERERERDVRERDRERERDRDLAGLAPPPPARGHWDERDRRFPSPPPPRMDTTGVGRSLSARLTDPYPPQSGGDERAYAPPPREFDRGRYGAPGLDDHARAPPAFSRVRNRSPSPVRPPVKRVREDNGPAYSAGGYARDYAPGPPPSSVAASTVPPRSAGTGTPPVSAPPPSSAASSAFYERGVGGEREREREYGVRGEWYERGRRSPPRVGYGRGVGDRRDDRRYALPPPRTS